MSSEILSTTPDNSAQFFATDHDAVDGYEGGFDFPDLQRERGPILLEELPSLVRPIVELIHDYQPDVVIAADRGARLAGFATMRSWQHRYPDERFPTNDQTLRLARVSSRGAKRRDVEKSIRWTLEESLDSLTQSQNSNSSPRIMFIDDWAVHGDTLKRFVRGVDYAALPSDTPILFATLVGTRITDSDSRVGHFVSNPERNPRQAEWDESDEIIGVEYGKKVKTLPSPASSTESREARVALIKSIDAYYSGFRAARSNNANATDELATQL